MPSERTMMKSSRSTFRNTTRPFTWSSMTVSPSSGVRKRSAWAARSAGGERGLPARLELLGRAPAAIDGSGSEQRLGARTVEGQALALVVRALVPGEAEPAEALEDGARRLLGRALAVRVLDAEHERA